MSAEFVDLLKNRQFEMSGTNDQNQPGQEQGSQNPSLLAPPSAVDLQQQQQLALGVGAIGEMDPAMLMMYSHSFPSQMLAMASHNYDMALHHMYAGHREIPTTEQMLPRRGNPKSRRPVFENGPLQDAMFDALKAHYDAVVVGYKPNPDGTEVDAAVPFIMKQFPDMLYELFLQGFAPVRCQRQAEVDLEHSEGEVRSRESIQQGCCCVTKGRRRGGKHYKPYNVTETGEWNVVLRVPRGRHFEGKHKVRRKFICGKDKEGVKIFTGWSFEFVRGDEVYCVKMMRQRLDHPSGAPSDAYGLVTVGNNTGTKRSFAEFSQNQFLVHPSQFGNNSFANPAIAATFGAMPLNSNAQNMGLLHNSGPGSLLVMPNNNNNNIVQQYLTSVDPHVNNLSHTQAAYHALQQQVQNINSNSMIPHNNNSNNNNNNNPIINNHTSNNMSNTNTIPNDNKILPISQITRSTDGNNENNAIDSREWIPAQQEIDALNSHQISRRESDISQNENNQTFNGDDLHNERVQKIFRYLKRMTEPVDGVIMERQEEKIPI